MQKRFKYAIIGVVAGVPLSYYFQPEILQKTLGFVDYIKNLSNFVEFDRIFRIQYFTENILTSVVVFAVIGFIIGYFEDKDLGKKES